MLRSAFLAAAVTLLPALALADAHSSTTANATLLDTGGNTIGRASLRTTPSGVLLVTISATDLKPGWHALHIHEKGECDITSGYKTAGGHLAGDNSHGVMETGGPHPGDLPNQMVRNDGTLTADIFALPDLKMTADSGPSILDADGSAFIIHEGRDDYASQPAGAAGTRVACGVIEPAK